MATAHEARLVPLETLKPYGRNPRRGDVGAIRESLRANGQYRPLVVRRKTREVLAGNHTLLAASEEGWSEVWATFVDVDAKQAKRIVLVDNRTNDLAGYDEKALAELIGELPDLTGTGYDEEAVRELVARSVLPDAEPPSDQAPEPPEEPTTRPGDLYALGEHRLLCGDARSATDIERLAAVGVARAMWTDPPYGVNYVGKTKDALRIEGDGAGGLDVLLAGAFATADTALEAGAAIYIAHPAGALSVTFGVRFLEQGWKLRQTLIWLKDTLVLGHADYHYKHEPILFGYKAGAGRRGRGGRGWFGDKQKPLGRPSEFTPEVEKAILDALAASASVTSACEAAGVGRTTYYRWLEQGEHEDGPEHFRDFRDATTRARARARLAYAAVIRRAASEGDWKAAAWALERLEPEEWALKRRLEHSGPGGSAIRHETVPDYSDPKVREAADVLLGRIEIDDETREAIREAGRRRARAQSE